MIVCDKLTEEQLEHIAFAARKWTRALSNAGLPPERYVEPEELAACNDLMAWFPAPPLAEEGGVGGG